MRLVKISTRDAGVVVCVEHELGRLERILVSEDPAIDHPAIARMVDAFNACEGLSDLSVRQLATGTATAGDLAERVVGMSLLYAHNPRLATKFIEEAQKHIAKQPGGKA